MLLVKMDRQAFFFVTLFTCPIVLNGFFHLVDLCKRCDWPPQIMPSATPEWLDRVSFNLVHNTQTLAMLWHLHLVGNQIWELSILVTCEWMICIEVLFHSCPQPISHLDPHEIYTWYVSPKFMLIKGIFFAGYTVGMEANCSQFLCYHPGTYRFKNSLLLLYIENRHWNITTH